MSQRKTCLVCACINQSMCVSPSPRPSVSLLHAALCHGGSGHHRGPPAQVGSILKPKALAAGLVLCWGGAFEGRNAHVQLFPLAFLFLGVTLPKCPCFGQGWRRAGGSGAVGPGGLKVHSGARVGYFRGIVARGPKSHTEGFHLFSHFISQHLPSKFLFGFLEKLISIHTTTLIAEKHEGTTLLSAHPTGAELTPAFLRSPKTHRWGGAAWFWGAPVPLTAAPALCWPLLGAVHNSPREVPSPRALCSSSPTRASAVVLPPN